MSNQYDSQIELMRGLNASLQERAIKIDEYIESQKGQIAALQSLCEELKKVNRSAKNASDSFGGGPAESLKSTSKSLTDLTKTMEKEVAASKSGGLLSRLAGSFKKLAGTAASVAALGFSSLVKGIVGMFKIMKVSIGALLDLGKGMISLVSALMGVISALYSKLIDMAHELMSGGSNAWAEAIRETKMHFGALDQEAPNAAIRMAKDMSAIPEAGLSVYKIFGSRGELLKEFMTDYVKKMEATFEIFAQEFADSSGALLGIAKGMGLGGEEMNTFAVAAITRGHPLGKELVDTHNAIWKVAKPFGISTKLISRDVAKAEKNVKNFGAATKESLVNAVVQSRILGIDFEKLDGLMGTFASIESSTEAGVKLFEAFEVEVDPYLLLGAQETGTMLDHLRDQFKKRGVDASKFNRANAGLLASVTGLSAETAKQAFSLQNAGKSIDEIQSRHDDGPNKTKSLGDALKELADSIEFKVLSGSMPKGGFLDMWLEGLYSQMFRNKHFRGLLRDIGKSLKVFYYEGTRFFNAFMEAVPAARGIFDSLRVFFNPELFKKLIGKVYGSFNKLFKGLGDGTYTFTNFMDDLKQAFTDHLDAFNKIDNGSLSKHLYDAALLTSKILGKTFTEISFLFSVGLRFIASTIRGDKTALNLISKSWKEMKKGFRGTFKPVSDAVSGVVDSIGSASKDLIDSYDQLMKRNNLDEYSSDSISDFANNLSKVSGSIFDKAVGWFNIIKQNAIKFFEIGKQWFSTATKVFINYIIPGLIEFSKFLQWYGVFSALATIGQWIWSKVAVSTKDIIMRGIKAFTSKFYSNTKRIVEAAEALKRPYGPIQQRLTKPFYLDPWGSITPKQYLNRLRWEYDSFIEGARKSYNDVKGASSSFGRTIAVERLSLAHMSFEDFSKSFHSMSAANQAKLHRDFFRSDTARTGLYGINDDKIIKLLEKSDDIMIRFARGLLTEEAAAAKLSSLDDQLRHLYKTNKHVPTKWAKLRPAQRAMTVAKIGGGVALGAAMIYNLLPLIKKDFVPNTNVIHATTIGFNLLGLADAGAVAIHFASRGAVSTASLAAKGIGATLSKVFFFVGVGAEILKFFGLGGEVADALSFSGMASAIVSAGDALFDNFLSDEDKKKKYEERAKMEEYKALSDPMKFRLPILESQLQNQVQNYLEIFSQDESSFLQLIQIDEIKGEQGILSVYNGRKFVKDWSTLPIFENWINDAVEKYVPLKEFSLDQQNKFRNSLVLAVNSAQITYIEGIQEIIRGEDYRKTESGKNIFDAVSSLQTKEVTVYGEGYYTYELSFRDVIEDPKEFASLLYKQFSEKGTNVEKHGEISALKLEAQLKSMNELITIQEQISSYSYPKEILRMITRSFAIIENIQMKPFVDFVHQVNLSIIKNPINYADLQNRMYNYDLYIELLKEILQGDLSEPWIFPMLEGFTFVPLGDPSLSVLRTQEATDALRKFSRADENQGVYRRFISTLENIISVMAWSIEYFHGGARSGARTIKNEIEEFDSSYIYFDDKTIKFLNEFNNVNSILKNKISSESKVVEVDEFYSNISSHPDFVSKLKEGVDYSAPHNENLFSNLFIDLVELKPEIEALSKNTILENLSLKINLLKPVIQDFFGSINASIKVLKEVIELTNSDSNEQIPKFSKQPVKSGKNKIEIKEGNFLESFQVFSEKITLFSNTLQQFSNNKPAFDLIKLFFEKTDKEISKNDVSLKLDRLKEVTIRLAEMTHLMKVGLFEPKNLVSFYEKDIPKIISAAESRIESIIEMFSPQKIAQTEKDLEQAFKEKCKFFMDSYNAIMTKNSETINQLNGDIEHQSEFDLGKQEIIQIFNGAPASRIGSFHRGNIKVDINYEFIFEQSAYEFENKVFLRSDSAFKDRIKILTEKLKWEEGYKIEQRTGKLWNKFYKIPIYYQLAKQAYPGPPQIK